MSGPRLRLVAFTLPELEALRDAFRSLVEEDDALPPLERVIDGKLERAVIRMREHEAHEKRRAGVAS